MVLWVKRLAMVLGAGAFFATFAASLDFADIFDFSILPAALIKAFIAFFVFWFAGFIIGDILLKGLVHDIAPDKSNLLEGGLLQHIYIRQAHESLEASEMQLVETVTENSKPDKKLKKKKGSEKSVVADQKA